MRSEKLWRVGIRTGEKEERHVAVSAGTDSDAVEIAVKAAYRMNGEAEVFDDVNPTTCQFVCHTWLDDEFEDFMCDDDEETEAIELTINGLLYLLIPIHKGAGQDGKDPPDD